MKVIIRVFSSLYTVVPGLGVRRFCGRVLSYIYIITLYLLDILMVLSSVVKTYFLPLTFDYPFYKGVYVILERSSVIHIFYISLIVTGVSPDKRLV